MHNSIFLLKKHNIYPSKKLGQNFLIDNLALAKIITAADLSPEDIVLEVGPGLGVLTLELAKKARKVIAVEKDKRMAEILKNVLAEKNIKNVEIIEEDILKIDILTCHPELVSGSLKMPKQVQHDKFPYKLVANIPYYLTSPLIRKFLESENPPQLMTLMIQKEVAQRICSKPPKMTLLAVATQFYAEPKIISYVSKNSFWPKPKVDSAIIKITPDKDTLSRVASGALRMTPEKASALRNNFFRVVKAGFSQPRKQLINNLSKGLKIPREKTIQILAQTGISPTQRPGELSVEKWVELTWIICGK